VPKEDQEKLQRLNKEREECLRPVRIRITSYDRMSPMMRLRSRAVDYDEEDIPIDALETLEMLKTSMKSSKANRNRNLKSNHNRNDSGNSNDSVSQENKLEGNNVECKIEEEQALVMEDSNSNFDSDQEMPDGVVDGPVDLRSSFGPSDDDDNSSSSSDFEINENAKEEGMHNLFDFAKDSCCAETKVVAVEQNMAVECAPTSPPSDTPSSD